MKKSRHAIKQAAYRERERAKGFIEFRRWVRPEWVAKIEQLIARLRS